MVTGKIKVKMIPRQNWSKFTLFDGCTREFQAPLDANIRKEGYVKTGLDPDEQEELEDMLRLPNGSLDSNSDYWISFRVKLDKTERILDLSNPSDYLDYKILCACSKRIAKNQVEAKNNPSAEYVLINEEEEAKIENEVVDYKVKAYVKYASLTPVEMRKALTILGFYVDNVEDEIVRNRLSKFIEANPKSFINMFEDSDFNHRSFIHELKQYGILTVKKKIWYYNEHLIGIDEETVIEYVKNKDNQEVIIIWKKELQKSKGKK